MKSVRTIRYLIFLVVLISCQESPETKFEKDGIRFVCPTGWKITEEQSIETGGYYLAIEKDGFNSSGILSVSWINTELDFTEWINIYKDELKDNIIYKNADLTFGKTYPAEFNTMRSTAIDFTANIVGLKHEGTILIFYENGKTFAVLKQQAVEDKVKNEKGFEAIEKSFSVNKGSGSID